MNWLLRDTVRQFKARELNRYFLGVRVFKANGIQNGMITDKSPIKALHATSDPQDNGAEKPGERLRRCTRYNEKTTSFSLRSRSCHYKARDLPRGRAGMLGAVNAQCPVDPGMAGRG